jgi:hypothetical protein
MAKKILTIEEAERKAEEAYERQKAKENAEKQRRVKTGVQLMADIKQLEVDFKQEKVRANLACQRGDFTEAGRIIRILDLALKQIKGVKQ